MSRAMALVAAAVWAATLAAPQSASITQQGDSPYCLFAVAAYLHDINTWQLAADYYRADLPTEADRVTPLNGPLIDWLAERGYPSYVYPRWDFDRMMIDLQQGHGPIAASIGRNEPLQHAIVLIARSEDRLLYVDSGKPGTHSISLEDFWQTQDGWYWRRQ